VNWPTPEDAEKEALRTEQRVAETRRLHEINRPENLRRKIRHLRDAHWDRQADSLLAELKDLVGDATGTSGTPPASKPGRGRGRGDASTQTKDGASA